MMPFRSSAIKIRARLIYKVLNKMADIMQTILKCILPGSAARSLDARSSIPYNVHCFWRNKHWNGNVIILIKFSSLDAPEFVVLTTSGASNNEKFIKMMTYMFQWTWTTFVEAVKQKFSVNWLRPVWARHIWPFSVNTMSADALAPHVSKTSAIDSAG